MTGIDRTVTGLNQDVYQALKSINPKDGLDQTEATKLKEAIEKDGKIDDSEADLLRELLASPVQLKVKGDQAKFAPQTLNFGKKPPDAGAKGILDKLLTTYLADSDSALADEVKSAMLAVTDGEVTLQDSQTFASLLKTIGQMPPERQKQVLPMIRDDLSEVARGKGKVDDVLQAAKAFDAGNPLKLEVDFDALARQRSAAKSGQTIDLAHSMGKDYDRFVYKADQYFEKTQGQLETEKKGLDAQIAAVQAKSPVDSTQLGQLTRVRDLTQALIEVHDEIGKSGHSKVQDRYADAGRVVEKIAEAQRRLADIRPSDMSPETRQQMESILQDYTAIAVTFPQQVGHPNAVDKLNSFYMQTYERVRELESGHRKGFPKTVDGALQTYPADVSDLHTFAQRFASLEGQLRSGSFNSEADYAAAMKKAVAGTSAVFQGSVDKLARAQWFSHQSAIQVQASANQLRVAQERANQATLELQAADKNYTDGTKQLNTLDSQEINQQNLSSAQSTIAKVDGLRQEAYKHLAEYDKLRKQGGDALKAAESHRLLAVSYLNTSDAFLGVVQKGAYAGQLKDQTAAVAAQNAALRDKVRELQAGISTTGDRFKLLDQARTTIESNLKDMGSRIKLSELDTKAVELAQGGIQQGRERINSHLLAYQDELDDATVAYLKDPAGFAKAHTEDNGLANVRKDLQELFKDHPHLAETVAKEMMTFKSDFTSVRGDIEKDLGQARRDLAANPASPELKAQVEQLENRVKRMDSIEHRLVDGWLGEQQTMIEALVQAGGDNDQVKKAMEATTEWVGTTQRRYAGNIVGDADQNKAAAQGFDDALSREDMKEYREKVEKTNAKYGTDDGSGHKKPVDTVPMVMVSEGTGAMNSFNAYVYKKGEGYMVLNPIDKKFYYGSTQAAALKEMATKSELGEATLHYKDANGVQQTRIHAPADHSTLDKVMAVGGFIGGVALLVLPEPTSKVGAVALFSASAAVFVSSTYFVAKGSIKMRDLIKNDNFGWNKETGLAAFDIGSGVLGMLSSAGTLGKAALASEATGALAQYTAKLAPLAKSNTLAKLNVGVGLGVGLPVAGLQLAEIYGSKTMTSSEKRWAAGQIVMFTATPLVIGGALKYRANRADRAAYLKEVTEVHTQLKTHLNEVGKAMENAQLPEVQAGAKPSLTQALKLARDYYEGIDAKAPKEAQAIKSEGLKQIAALEAKLAGFPDVKVRPDATIPKEELGALGEKVLGEVTEVTSKGKFKEVKSKLEVPEGQGRKVFEEIAKKKGLIRDPKSENIFTSADKKTQLIYDTKNNQIKLRDSENGFNETITLEKPGSGPAVKLRAPVLDEVKGSAQNIDEAQQTFDKLIQGMKGFEDAKVTLNKSGNGEREYIVKSKDGSQELLRVKLQKKAGGFEISVKGKADIKLNANKEPEIVAADNLRGDSNYKMKLEIPEAPLPKNLSPAEYKTQLAERVAQRAKDVENPDSIHYDPKHGPMVTAVVDPKSGKVFYGTNVEKVPVDLHPLLKQRLDLFNEYMAKYKDQFMAEGANAYTKKLITHADKPGTHSEYTALDQALRAREQATGKPATVQDMMELAMSHQATEGHVAGSCFNCTHIAAQGGTPSLSGDKTGIITLPPGVPSFQDFLKATHPEQKVYDFGDKPAVKVPPVYTPTNVYVPPQGVGRSPAIPKEQPVVKPPEPAKQP